jgi:hypothetical protein
MKSKSLSGILTSGVGRRIFVFFLLAGILPVVVTALLAYFEIGRGLEKDVSRQLRESSKSYGTEVVERLLRLSEKADEIVRVVGDDKPEAIPANEYLVDDFEAISVSSSQHGLIQLSGGERFIFDSGKVNFEHLAADRFQFLIVDEFDMKSFYLLRGANIGGANQSVYAFHLDSEALWGAGENSPYLTNFCVFTLAGESLFCTDQTVSSSHDKAMAGSGINGSLSLNGRAVTGPLTYRPGGNCLSKSFLLYPHSTLLAHNRRSMHCVPVRTSSACFLLLLRW